MTTTIFTVWKAAIPAACFQVTKRVRARVTGIAGVDTVDLEIMAITVGSGDTDIVSLRYNQADTGGIALTNCNLSAFYCLTDCCQTSACFTALTGHTDILPVVETTYEFTMGMLVRSMLVDSITISLPKCLSDTPLTSIGAALQFGDYVGIGDTAVANGNTLSVSDDGKCLSVTVNRAAFLPPFDTGLFEAGFPLRLALTNLGVTEDLTPGPVQVCLNGKYL